MPRINRIRIAGLYYNSMKKKYDDLVFDFNDGEASGNGLISMMNGGGKGVLLQTVFQLFKPGTSWGEKDNRVYQQFFHNERRTFKPYTFHVVIEWLLDGDDERYLLTGVACSAKKVVSEHEDENDHEIKPDFLFYQKEYGTNEDWLSQINLYQKGEGVEIENLRANLRVLGLDPFVDRKKHYKILKSYGVDRKDFDTQKKINKAEGGVGKFFEGAEDDYTLFRNKVIPIISESMEQQSSQTQDLVEIFKSQASIAKNLPVLLSREGSHKEFLELIKPVEEAVDAGIELQQDIRHHMLRGNRLYSSLSHLIERRSEDISEFQQEIEQVQTKINDLYFEKDNIEYIQQKKELIELERQLQELEEEKEALSQSIDDLEAKEKDFNIQLLLLDWNEVNQVVKSIKERIDQLESSQDMQDTKESIRKLEEDTAHEWEKSQVYLSDTVNRYETLMHQFEDQLESLEKDRNRLKDERAIFSVKIDNLEEESQKFKEKEDEILEQFGEAVIFDVESTLTETKQDISSKQKEQYTLEAQLEASQQQLHTLELKERELQTGKKTDEETLNQLQEKLSQQEEAERQLRQRLVPYVKEDLSSDVRSWLERALRLIKQEETHIREELEANQRKLWQKQINHSLNQEEFWVANQDLKLVKEKLEQDIEIYYGTEFLLDLNEAARRNELAQHPLLPYGLIVADEKSLSLVNDELNQLFVQSPVPIFIREKMSEPSTTQFHILNGTGHEFAVDPKQYKEWKGQLTDEVEEILALIEELKESNQHVVELSQQTQTMLAQELSGDIQEDVQRVQLRVNDYTEQLNNIDVEKGQLEDRIEIAKSSLSQIAKTMAELEEHVKELETYQKELEQENQRQQELEASRSKLDTVKQSIQKKDEEIKSLSSSRESWSDSFRGWKFDYGKLVDRLKDIVSDASMPESVGASDDVDEPRFDWEAYRKLENLRSQHDYLKQSLENQDKELAVLEEKRRHKQESQGNIEQDLGKLDVNWKSRDIPSTPRTVIEKRLEEHTVKLHESKSRLSDVDGDIKGIVGQHSTMSKHLEQMNEKIEKAHHRAPYFEAVDVDRMRIHINQELQKHDQQQREYRDELDRYEREIRVYETKQNQLFGAGVTENDTPFEQSELELVRKEESTVVEEWINNKQQFDGRQNHTQNDLEREVNELKLEVEERDWDFQFKNDVIKTFNQLNLREYQHIKETISRMVKFSRKSLDDLKKEKEDAEKAQEYWANRAALKVITISDHIKKMVQQMRFKNQVAVFPLVQLKEDILPRKPEEVQSLLREYFIGSIKKLNQEFKDLDERNQELVKRIHEYVSDEQIMLVALRNSYPELEVYNMQTSNVFTYGRPRKEHYSTWRTINKGSAMESDGSGGQKLAARMIIMMMLLSMKNESEQHWTPLFLDNPFGQAASEHVLDPIFKVSEELKFQLIIVTPPELVKTEISQRFPVYYKLDFNKVHGKEIVTEKVQYSYRMYS
ncbi:hypothetical protein ACTWQB_12070 [Piscibacillus sp. B03]|uniref:hypothetical protein n=1 Tax=Piscibacillus sp. B03 TaxID=3457430 RepID=UPI003FCD77F6